MRMRRVRPAKGNGLVSVVASTNTPTPAQIICTHHEVWYRILKEVFLLPFVIVFVVGHISIGPVGRIKNDRRWVRGWKNRMLGIKRR